MWNLDNNSLYAKFIEILVTSAVTWGADDRNKREAIRKTAAERFPSPPPPAGPWAFRITARKRSTFDIDNIPKLVVDAFCGSQIAKDGSEFHQLILYPEDTVEHVGMVQVRGERCFDRDSTLIEIFSKLGAMK
jgi:hypothetical protein